MVANVQDFPKRSYSFAQVPSVEESLNQQPLANYQDSFAEKELTQRQGSLDDTDLFDWRKIESLRFVVQVGFSVVLMGFCMAKLATLDTKPDSDKAIYWSGMVSIIAWWMPTPGGKGTTQPQK